MMSEEKVLEEEKTLLRGRARKVIIRKQTVMEKTETITIEEFEQPSVKQPIVRSLEFKPVAYAKSARATLPEESYEATSIDDSECRKELIQLVNLPSLPGRRNEAFDELYGMFDNIVEAREEVNVTDWVRSLRRRT